MPAVRPHPFGNNLSNATRSDFDHSPLIVFYEVTRACDLVCLHCRACAQPESDPNELPAAQSRLLIDQLADFPKPPMLVLTGGDPLKRPDIYELISYAADSGIDVSITPSATPLVTREAIERLRDSGISRIAISIDGPRPSGHDKMRGVPGSFQCAMEIMDHARSCDIPVQINTTITRDNIDDIDAMAELLEERGIVLWSVFFLVPVGRASEDLRLSAAEYEIAFERLWQQTKRRSFAIKTTAAPHYRRFVLQHKKSEHTATAPRPLNHPRRPLTLGVNDGKGVMFVGHTGLVSPSGFMPIVCGLFPMDHIVRVYQQSPIFRGLRDASRLEGKCGLCEYRNVCGGSRARSYALTGNPFAEEPDCVYEPGNEN